MSVDQKHEAENQPTRPEQIETRRKFLGQAIGIAAAGSLFAGEAAAAGQSGTSALTGPIPKAKDRVPLADGDPIRMAIIGTGGMGSGHMGAFMRFNERDEHKVHIVALCDVNKVRLDKAHKKAEEQQGFKVDRYVDYKDVLARDDIHGVLVASPEHWHHQMAIDALAAGKDLYLEKPMTLHFEEAMHLRQVVLKNPDMIFQVGTQKMILPKWVEAKKLIAAGAIGKPVFSQTSYCRNSMNGEWLYYGIDPKVVPGPNLDWERWCGPKGKTEFDGALYARWRRYKNFSTGITGDLLVHVMTPLMMALDAGWPTRVTSSGGRYIDMEMENHDQINMTIEFETGHTMIVAGSTCNEIGLETIIRGHKATMYLNGRNVDIRPERIFADDIDPQEIQCPNIGNDQDQLRINWLECVRSREPAVSGIDLASKMMVAVSLATRSMWEGSAFTFDPKTMTARKA